MFLLRTLFFLSSAQIKVSPEKLLNLKFDDIKPNQVNLVNGFSIKVDGSASPLFYKLEQKITQLTVAGKVDVNRPIEDLKEDTYFAVGLVFPGDFRPGFFKRLIMPDWLLKVLELHPTKGIGAIQFYEASKGKSYKFSSSTGGVKITRQTLVRLSEEGRFEMKIPLPDSELLGLWIRADGDNSDAAFLVEIDKFIVK